MNNHLTTNSHVLHSLPTAQPAQKSLSLYGSILDLFREHTKSFCQSVFSCLPEDKRLENILDLSGSHGVLGSSLMEWYPQAHIDIYENELQQAIVSDYMKSRCLAGDFTLISGEYSGDTQYDLLIMPYSCDLDRVDVLQEYLERLNQNGILLLLWKTPSVLSDQFDLFSHLCEKNSSSLRESKLIDSLEAAGFYTLDQVTDCLLWGELFHQSEDIVTAAGVNRAFIELTERIANGRTNVLSFDGPDMVFTRSEIHLIKMIGLNPGIYSAELARLFGITRPVVHKALSKLSDRGFVLKKDDETDKKKLHLYLTEQGWRAYRCHEQYHKENDQALLDFLSGCTDEQLHTIGNFLKHAIKLIENHA